MRWASWLFKAQWQSDQQLESWWGQARRPPTGALASTVTQGPASNQVHTLEKPAGRRGQQVEKPSTQVRPNSSQAWRPEAEASEDHLRPTRWGRG